MKPTIGEPAPAFSAAVIGGDYSEETQIQLSDFTGKKVVLYFYPKTPPQAEVPKQAPFVINGAK